MTTAELQGRVPTEHQVPMDAELKRKWVQALRSGVYVQGFGALRRPLGYIYGKPAAYCCLGVLCELIPGGWENQYKAGMDAVLAVDNFVAAGLDLGFDQMKLANMNDIDKMPFESIAGWIEENL
jgi:hypothetical protein